MAVAYDPFSREYVEDPYPMYEQLREEEPVHFAPALGVFVISRFDDVVGSLRDHATYSSAGGMRGGLGSIGDRFLIFSDPPDHTKLRRLVQRPFTPSRIAKLEPRIRDICESLVDDLIAANESGQADLVEHVGVPLPVTVIAEMLGIPPERRDDFKRWSDHLIGSTSPDCDFGGAAQSGIEMFTYFGEVVQQRRRDPGEDLISMLVTGAEPLTTDEIVLFCVLLLVAGNETTTNLLSNATLAFFRFPDEAKRVAADPSLIPAALDEALRYDSPVQTLGRTVTRDIELHGVHIPRSSRVLPLYASANRDRRHYDDPDTFRIDRRATDHVAFGSGIHYCLGASLAKLEATIVLETLGRRTRDMERAGAGERVHNVIVRGMRKLPVALRPA